MRRRVSFSFPQMCKHAHEARYFGFFISSAQIGWTHNDRAALWPNAQAFERAVPLQLLPMILIIHVRKGQKTFFTRSFENTYALPFWFALTNNPGVTYRPAFVMTISVPCLLNDSQRSRFSSLTLPCGVFGLSSSAAKFDAPIMEPW